MKKLFAAALSATVLAVMPGAASADQFILSAPLAGATMHSNDVALSVYFSPTETSALEIVVTYVGDAEPNLPRRIVMALSDGERVRFGLPEHPGTLYEFARTGNTITVADEVVGQRAPQF